MVEALELRTQGPRGRAGWGHMSLRAVDAPSLPPALIWGPGWAPGCNARTNTPLARGLPLLSRFSRVRLCGTP